ncbi:hypothetical protein BD410DRAFT_783664 [Rickenella mellea]|uniref:F-box domain-containing protein n=1 Tax=Rickenella mellea TaxID=50990 RepID=A0A4Y7QH58_9AGAM|nr:hypothetical protein BD410DRAFT_783664 [Rickenella mellea]
MRRHLTSAYASILPTELLCEILTLAEDNRKPDAYIPASQVCRRWREVTLDSPLLWNKVTFPHFSLEKTREMLRRSKVTPLTVHVDGILHNRSNLAFFNEIVPHLPRIQQLCITIREHNAIQNHPVALLILNCSLPNLEILELKLHGDPDEQILFTHPLLGGEGTNLLKHVTLIHFAITWSSSLLRGLSTLFIALPSSNSQPSVGELLDILQACPSITDFTYEVDTPRSAWMRLMVRQTKEVKLAQLKYLSLDMDYGECTQLLHHLHMPAIKDFKIRCQRYVIQQPLVVLLRELPYPSQHRITCRLSTSTVCVSAITNTMFTVPTSYQGEVEMHWNPPPLRRTPFHILIKLIQSPSFPSASTTTFDLILESWADKALWIQLLGFLPNVRHLRLTVNENCTISMMEDFLDALTASNESETHIRHMQVLPQLLTLEFDGSFPEHRRLADKLYDFAQVRRDCDTPLRVLRLWKPETVPLAYISNLQIVIDEVTAGSTRSHSGDPAVMSE